VTEKAAGGVVALAASLAGAGFSAGLAAAGLGAGEAVFRGGASGVLEAVAAGGAVFGATVFFVGGVVFLSILILSIRCSCSTTRGAVATPADAGNIYRVSDVLQFFITLIMSLK